MASPPQPHRSLPSPRSLMDNLKPPRRVLRSLRYQMVSLKLPLAYRSARSQMVSCKPMHTRHLVVSLHVSDVHPAQAVGPSTTGSSRSGTDSTTCLTRTSLISSPGQPQAPTGPVISQISDGQPQVPTGPVITQISDGQPQVPTEAPAPVITQISDGMSYFFFRPYERFTNKSSRPAPSSCSHWKRYANHRRPAPGSCCHWQLHSPEHHRPRFARVPRRSCYACRWHWCFRRCRVRLGRFVVKPCIING